MQTQRRSQKPESHLKVSGLEYRYRRAVALARSCKTTRETKALEIDIAHTINHIDKYGFEFFSNHYIRDEVLRFEAMISQLQFALTQQPKTQ